ncbi:MAG: CbiX/SirB N-terminal domain-containing protein [Kyrpidia sp.]|nr:CbiX/SirB N-terminal domain-containing protein [Kyrpidia sp.]
MKRTALLLIAHGSQLRAAAEDMFRVMDDLRSSGKWDIVEAAFLEITFPSIPEGIEICVNKGATQVVIVPYFLHLGKHVLKDLPRLIDEAGRRHPGVQIRLGSHLGYDPRLSHIVAERAEEALAAMDGTAG